MNSPNLRTRLAGAAVGALAFAVAAWTVQPDSALGLLLADRSTMPRTLPYPLTIHLILYVLAGLTLAELYSLHASYRRELAATDSGLLPTQPGAIIATEELAELTREANEQSRVRPSFTTDCVLECVAHFALNRSVADAHHVLRSLSDLRRQRITTDYVLVRYLIWAIPTVGFLGTVVGISGALIAMQPLFASEAPTADLVAPVVQQLGMAFNTTIVALVLSAVLTWLAQHAMGRESHAIDRASEYVLRNLLNRLYDPQGGRGVA